MDFYLDALWRGVLVPAAAMGGIAFLGRLAAGSSRAAAALAGAFGVGLGFLAAYLALGWAPLRPEEGWHWLAYLPFLGVPIVLLSLPSLARAVHIFLLAAAAMGAAWLLTPQWEDFLPERSLWLVIVWGTIFLAASGWWSGEYESLPKGAEVGGDAFLLGWGVPVFAAAAGVLMLSGNAKLAQLMGAGAALAGAGALGACCCVPRGAALGMIPGLAILLGGLLWQGKFHSFSEVPAVCYGLPPIGLALLGPAARLRCCGRWGAHLAAALLVLTSAGAAVFWAWKVSGGGDEW